MNWIASVLAKNPEFGVYLALGIGHWIGGWKIRGFSLGGVTGSLLVGIAIGVAFDIPISSAAKSLVFMLFLFGIGYSVGPKFFSAMKGDGWRFAVLGIFMPVLGLLTAWMVARYLKLDPGFAAGMLSGALTESPAIGTAVDAISALPISDELKLLYTAHVGIGDALCYLFGALGVMFVCGTFGPWVLGVDMRAEALKLEAVYGISRARAGVDSAWHQFEFRAYRLIANARAAGKTVAEAERLVPDARLFALRIRRGDEIMAATPSTMLQAGDVVVVGGRRDALVNILGQNAVEVEDRELLEIPVASFELYVSKKEIDGQTVEQLALNDSLRGVFLRGFERQGQQIPVGLRTVVERGDVLHVIGTEAGVERAAEVVGEIVRPSEMTDFVVVGLAIFFGGLIGIALSFPIAGISLSIGASVGTLLAGILVGYLRSRRPLFGHISDGAVQFMQAFGLAGFLAMVGIGAGPHFISALREAGVSILLGGIIVTLVPLIFGLYFGRYALKINPILLLGAIAGAQTFTAALAEVQQKSASPIAVIGYSGAVPVAHVFLTLWGTVIVLLMSP